MKKLFATLSLLFVSGWAHPYSTVYNPWTQKPDYVGSTSSITLTGDVTGTGTGTFATTLVHFPSGATSYIQNSSTPQTGSTFSVSSGTISGQLILGSLNTGTSISVASNTWTAGNTLPQAVMEATMIKLNSGKILAIGGSHVDTDPFKVSVNCSIFDPVTKVWTSTGSLNLARGTGTPAVKMANGDVLVFGGYNAAVTTATTSAEIFLSTAGIWVSTTPMNQARWGVGGALLPDGSVLAIGGSDTSNNHYATCEVFKNGVWTSTASYPSGLNWPSVAPLSDGRILVAGGDLDQTTVGSNAAYFLNGAWTTVNSGYTGLSSSMNGVNITMDSNGLVYLIGGSGPPTGTITNHGEYFDPNSNTWTAIADFPQTKVAAAGIWADYDNTIIVAGGDYGGGQYANVNVYRYAPASNAWTRISDMNSPRGYVTTNISGPQPKLNGGQIFIAGGQTNSVNLNTVDFLSTSTITTTSSGTIISLGSLTTSTATLASLNVSGSIYVSSAAISTDEYSNGAYVATSTITWANGNFQKVTLTANTAFNFIAPAHPATLTLDILTGAGGFACTWPGSVVWPAATAPTITATASKHDFVVCKYASDGNYYCSAAGTQNFYASAPQPIALVQEVSFNGTTGTIAATGSGNLLVLMTQVPDGEPITAVSDTAGNTWSEVPGTAIGTGPTDRRQIWYCANSNAGETSVVLTVSGGTPLAVFAEFSGVALTSPIVDAQTISASGTNKNGLVLTTVTGNELLVSGLACAAANPTSIGSPWIILDTDTGQQFRGAYRIDAGTIGAISTSWAPTQTDAYVANGAVFAAAP